MTKFILHSEQVYWASVYSGLQTSYFSPNVVSCVALSSELEVIASLIQSSCDQPREVFLKLDQLTFSPVNQYEANQAQETQASPPLLTYI